MVKNTMRFKTRQSRRDFGPPKAGTYPEGELRSAQLLHRRRGGTPGNHGRAAYLLLQVEPFLADQRRCSFASEQPPLSVTCRKNRQLGSLRPDTKRGHELRQEKKLKRSAPSTARRHEVNLDGQEELFRLKDVVTRRRGVRATGHAPSLPLSLPL